MINTKNKTPEELFAAIRALSPVDQLRMSADLLEAKKPKLALGIIKNVYEELELLRLTGAF